MAKLHDERRRRRAAPPEGLLLSASLRALAAAPQAEWSHHCSACGKCCNSPPLLVVPELFHHERRFFGCLAIRRVEREPGVGHGAPDDSARRFLHRPPRTCGEAHDVLLVTQAFDDRTSERCPALSPEQRCAVHDDKKPAACRAVPLDAFAPDRSQHRILAVRASDARSWGQECIAPGIQPNFAPLVSGLRVVNDGARSALDAHRRALSEERRFWGDAVFRLLSGELFSNPKQFEQLPTAGFFVLSLAPVLLVVAQASDRARARCITFLDAQHSLGQRMLATLETNGQRNRPCYRELNAFLQTNLRLRSALMAGRPGPLAPPQTAAAVEQWLGLEPITQEV